MIGLTLMLLYVGNIFVISSMYSTGEDDMMMILYHHYLQLMICLAHHNQVNIGLINNMLIIYIIIYLLCGLVNAYILCDFVKPHIPKMYEVELMIALWPILLLFLVITKSCISSYLLSIY